MLGLSQSTANSVKGGFVDLLTAAFDGLSDRISNVLVPPVFDAISAFERLFALIDRIRGKSGNDAQNQSNSVSPDLSKAPLGAIQSAFSVQNSATAVSSAVSVNLNATLVADGYQLARVAMRNLDDAVAAL